MADRPLDKIHIRELRTRCIVGVNPPERQKKQDIVVHLTLHADLRRAGRSDDIHDTVDYKEIKQDVLAMVEQSSYLLLERLAERIPASPTTASSGSAWWWRSPARCGSPAPWPWKSSGPGATNESARRRGRCVRGRRLQH